VSDVETSKKVPYPHVSLVTRLPVTLQGKSPLTFHCRTFESFTLSFADDSEAIDVFESVKELTVASCVFPSPPFFFTGTLIPPFFRSIRHTALRVLLHAKSTPAHQIRMVDLLPPRRVWADGRGDEDKGVEIHGH
jgi:hypothetical protein